jgi:hypothetical protein
MMANDFDRFVSALDAVMDLYAQQKPLTAAARGIWFKALERFDLLMVERALVAHVGDPAVGQHPPKPADVIRALQGTNSDAAEGAWAKVHNAIIRVGQYRPMVFDDPIIHACIEAMGGWTRLAEADSSDMAWRGKEFVAHYDRLRRNPPAAYPAVVNGQFDSASMAMIGDRSVCEQVRSNGSRSGSVVQISDARRLRDALASIPQREAIR